MLSHPTPALLLSLVLASELALMRTRLSGDPSRRADRGSLRLLFAVIFASIGLAWLTARAVPQARIDALPGLGPDAMAGVYRCGVALFLAGLGLRWYAIGYLGRLFTFDVAIAADHPVIDTGPYRFIRHPAYTGSLLTFLGVGLCGGNLLALPVLMTPIACAFLRRIGIEEAALETGLGTPYRDYARRTKRLIPFVY
jgi:protein-S-isoprenylcysteine O-methyltransferase